MVKSDPHYRLMRACVQYALSPVIMSKSRVGVKWRNKMIDEAYDARIKFADSDLLRIWCDVAELDYKRVRGAIIKYNRYNIYE